MNDGMTLASSDCVRVLELCMRKKLWDDATRLFFRIQSVNREGREQQFSTSAFGLLQLHQQRSVSKSLIHHHARTGLNPSLAEKIWRVSAAGASPDKSIEITVDLVRGYGMLGDWQNAERLYWDYVHPERPEAPESDAKVGEAGEGAGGRTRSITGGVDKNVLHLTSALLSAMARGGAPRARADAIFQRVLLGASTDIVAYSAMLSVCEKEADVDALLEIWDRVPVAKDAIAFNTALACVCRAAAAAEGTNFRTKKSRLLSVLEKLLEEMHETGVTKTSVTLNTVVRACEILKEPEKGLGFISKYFLLMLSERDSTRMTMTTLRHTTSPFVSARPTEITRELLAQVTERLESCCGGGMIDYKDQDSKPPDHGVQPGISTTTSTSTPTTQSSRSTLPSLDYFLNGLVFSSSSSVISNSNSSADACSLLASERDYAKAQLVLKTLQTALADILKNGWVLVPYGSLVCGTGGPGADLDVTLMHAGDLMSSTSAPGTDHEKNIVRSGHGKESEQMKNDRQHIHRSRDLQQRVLLQCVACLQEQSQAGEAFSAGHRMALPLQTKTVVPPPIFQKEQESSEVSGGTGVGPATLQSREEEHQTKKIPGSALGIVEARLGGRVPVVALEVNGTPIDLTVDNWHALAKTSFVREEARRFLGANRLCAYVKQWAKREKVFGQPMGYLGGYAWTLMVLHFLRTTTKGIKKKDFHLSPPAFADEDEAFLEAPAGGFFQYFATDYQWDRGEVIDVENLPTRSSSSSFSSTNQSDESLATSRTRFLERPALVLMDPVETTWNLGNILNSDRLALTRSAILKRARFLTMPQHHEEAKY
ncbi:unnamed protein product [Amoebophrya sp. A25]|nr:unnamed protein product [Amoebophrya sp. A25]|eukprot:GSA25T00010297001.1